MLLVNQTFPNYTIKFMSNEWIVNSGLVFVIIISFLIIGRSLSAQNNKRVTYLMGAILFSSSVINPILIVLNGEWNMVTDFPLHLCGMSCLICSFLPFMKRKQFLFDFVFYSGIIGGITSILTPQINAYDGSQLVYIEYYVRHVLILLMPLYMFKNLNIKPSKYSYLKSFLILNILIVIIMPLNFYLGSNYMYLSEPPQVNNPLLIGQWPYYLLWLEVFVFLLMAAFYGLSKLNINVTPKMK
tara:strand:+ start:4049 stop:4774 length:726 start_codon:yes stop_codon:yes gene_type:complete